MNITTCDALDLERAVLLLEKTSLAARISALLGGPVNALVGYLPQRVQRGLAKAVRKSLEQALTVSTKTLGKTPKKPARWLHTSLVTVAGAASGALGATALALELPITTCLMLRSIADIARSEGEDLDDPAARISCFEVFALGGPAGNDATGLGYFAVRRAMALEIARATQFLFTGVSEEAAPAFARLIESVAARFGLVAQEKVAAQLVPVIGAVGGATLNLLFMKHFQDLATGHFIVRRLERSYGQDPVLELYQQIAASL